MKKILTNIIGYIHRQLWPGLKLAFCFISFALLQVSVTAQPTAKDIKISGKVNSAVGEPVIGVTVRVKNSAIATTTDANGHFTLTAP
jgi:hypothetical protein